MNVTRSDVYFPSFPSPDKSQIEMKGGKVIMDKSYWDQIVYYVYETELAIEKAGY